MKNLILGVLLLVSLQPGVVVAQERFVTVYGVGNRSCGEWTSEKSTPHHYEVNKRWILGFVSAAGIYAEEKIFSPPDRVALIAWIDNYCQKNPLDMVTTASTKLVTELQSRYPQ